MLWIIVIIGILLWATGSVSVSTQRGLIWMLIGGAALLLLIQPQGPRWVRAPQPEAVVTPKSMRHPPRISDSSKDGGRPPAEAPVRVVPPPQPRLAPFRSEAFTGLRVRPQLLELADGPMPGTAYARLVDNDGGSPRAGTHLLAQAHPGNSNAKLQTALGQLQEGIHERNEDRARYWVGRVLALQPNQPDGVAALGDLNAQGLQRARAAYRLGENNEALRLLSLVTQPDYRHHGEWVQLVLQVEAQLNLETSLADARANLTRGRYLAAQALVTEALRRDPSSSAALTLQDEIDSLSGFTGRRMLAALIGLTLAGLLMGSLELVIHLCTARKLKSQRNPSFNAPPLGGPALALAGPSRTLLELHTPLSLSASEPQSALHLPSAMMDVRRIVLNGIVTATRERLRSVREANALSPDSARAADLEADLRAIAACIADPSADLTALNWRVRTLHQQASTLHIDPPSQQSSARTSGDPAGIPAPGTAAVPNYYDVLQVKPNASAEEIRAAYLRLLKQYHPDLHTASRFGWVRTESDRMSRQVFEAYRVLSDGTRRSRSDRALRNGKKNPRRSSP